MAAPEEKTALKIVFGAMTFGREGVEQARVHKFEEVDAILDTFQKHGHREVDTARVYGNGSSEEYLGQLAVASKRGIVLHTKVGPNSSGTSSGLKSTATYSFSAPDLRRALTDSLAALKVDHIDIWYLHWPDHNVPIEETLEAVDALYREGKFKRFGLSNYSAWQVARIAETAIRKGWKRPDVYQGVYNGLHRAVEPELLPALRHYGISFYLYNPLAGGLLTDRYQRDTDATASSQKQQLKQQNEPGSRFDPARSQGANYRERYWNDAYFDALDLVRPAARKLGISTAEAALRWTVHHSQLRREYGDAIIIGASSGAQLEENLAALEKGPLPDELLQAFDAGWQRVKSVAKPYFR